MPARQRNGVGRTPRAARRAAREAASARQRTRFVSGPALACEHAARACGPAARRCLAPRRFLATASRWRAHAPRYAPLRALRRFLGRPQARCASRALADGALRPRKAEAPAAAASGGADPFFDGDFNFDTDQLDTEDQLVRPSDVWRASCGADGQPAPDPGRRMRARRACAALRCAALLCVRLVAPRRGGRRQHGSKPDLQPGLLTRGARCQAGAELFDRAMLVRMELDNRSKSGVEPVATDAKDLEASQVAMEAEEASAVAPVLARCTRARSARRPAKRSLAPRCAAPKTAARKRASTRNALPVTAAAAAARREANARSHAAGVQRGAACRAAAGDEWATGVANRWTREELAELQFAADDNWRYTKSQSGIQWAKIKDLVKKGLYPLLKRHLHTNNANNRCLGKEWNKLAALGLVLSPSRNQ
jgi:hypothetical protein